MKRRTGIRARNVQFDLGFVCATVSAGSVLEGKEMDFALSRHARGDWGDVGHQVRFANKRALREKSYLFSIYHATSGREFWILTVLNRHMTTILLPEDVSPVSGFFTG